MHCFIGAVIVKNWFNVFTKKLISVVLMFCISSLSIYCFVSYVNFYCNTPKDTIHSNCFMFYQFAFIIVCFYVQCNTSTSLVSSESIKHIITWHSVILDTAFWSIHVSVIAITSNENFRAWTQSIILSRFLLRH